MAIAWLAPELDRQSAPTERRRQPSVRITSRRKEVGTAKRLYLQDYPIKNEISACFQQQCLPEVDER